jgi:hypothetical protein
MCITINYVLSLSAKREREKKNSLSSPSDEILVNLNCAAEEII